MATRRCCKRGLVSRRHLERRARRLSDPPFVRPRALEPRRLRLPRGQAPGWTARAATSAISGRRKWRKVGDEYWLCYTARRPTIRWRSASPGRRARPGRGATSAIRCSPAARQHHRPRRRSDRPLQSGGVIDAHIFVDGDGERYLFWKLDTNGIWLRPLASLLRERPELIDRLFESEADRRTAAFAAAIVPWANQRRPMERFFLMQPLIEAVLDNWPRVRGSSSVGRAGAILEAMRTPIHAQRLAADGGR